MTAAVIFAIDIWQKSLTMHADLTENADSDLHKLLTEIQHTDDEQQALQA